MKKGTPQSIVVHLVADGKECTKLETGKQSPKRRKIGIMSENRRGRSDTKIRSAPAKENKKKVMKQMKMAIEVRREVMTGLGTKTIDVNVKKLYRFKL